MPEPRLAIDRGVATVTLSDPYGMNPLDPSSLAALRQAVASAVAREDVGAIVLRAEARAFCAGGDVEWFAADADTLHDGILGLAGDGAALVQMLHRTPKVTIAAVHGAVAGAGLGVALACDVVIAAEQTAFATAYARLGASPDLGVSSFLVRDLGYRRALELCLLAETFDAADALRLASSTTSCPTTSSTTRRIAWPAGSPPARAWQPRRRSGCCGSPPGATWMPRCTMSSARWPTSAEPRTGARAWRRSASAATRSSAEAGDRGQPVLLTGACSRDFRGVPGSASNP